MSRRMWPWLAFVVLAVAVPLAALAAKQASADPEAGARVLRVGTMQAPPFAMKGEDGEWQGLAIDLWLELAATLGLRFEFEERPLQDLVKDIADGSLDVVVGLTITGERERVMDFSHPFHTAGLAIAVPRERRGAGWLRVAEQFFSLQFAALLMLLLLVLLVSGVLVWLFERRRNQEMFGGGPAKGIGSGVWWSAVTMTTVGYGDKAPKTLGGRMVALVWMFASVIILSSFMAAITSSLTLGGLHGSVRGLSDLPRVRVGTLAGSVSAEFLAANNIRFVGFENLSDGLQSLADGTIAAFVQDAPLLVYRVNTDFKDRLEVLPGTFSRQDYGVALSDGSALREPLNVALLAYIHSETWQRLLDAYFKS